jgi:hypothetical protein
MNLKVSQSALTLSLSIAVLCSFQYLGLTRRPHDRRRSQLVGLIALDHLIDLDATISDIHTEESQVTVQDTLLSFCRAMECLGNVKHALPAEILFPFSTNTSVPNSADRFADHYWTARFIYDLDHKGTMARIWDDFEQHVPKKLCHGARAPVLPPLYDLDSSPSVHHSPLKEKKSLLNIWAKVLVRPVRSLF